MSVLTKRRNSVPKKPSKPKPRPRVEIIRVPAPVRPSTYEEAQFTWPAEPEPVVEYYNKDVVHTPVPPPPPVPKILLLEPDPLDEKMSLVYLVAGQRMF